MNKQLNYRICIIFILLLLSTTILQSQILTDADVKTGFIYKFTQLLEWQDPVKSDTFYIAVYGTDDIMFKSLKQLETVKILNKPVQVQQYKKRSNIKLAQLLYINYSQNPDIELIYNDFKDLNTLLITDRCENKRFVYINFIHDADKKIQFEINTANLHRAGFVPQPKLLLIGGTEIDVRNLYLETEKTLSTEKEKTQFYTNELQKTKKEILKKNKQLSALNNQIDTLLNKIKTRTRLYEEMADEITQQQDTLAYQQTIVENQKNRIDEQEKKLIEQQNEMQLKLKQIDEYTETLDKLKSEIKDQKKEINSQQDLLSTQDSKIEKQRLAIYLFILVTVLILILVFQIYKSNKVIRQKNLQLEHKNSSIIRKNKEIGLQSEEIMAQADSLKKANKMLEKQNIEIEHTLDKLKNAQIQLVHSEKMATLGQLTAGIAHEINNPVNFINTGIDGLEMAYEDISQILELLSDASGNNMKSLQDKIDIIKKDILFDELTEDIPELISNIKIGVKRTTEIVKELRVFSRLEEDVLKTSNIHKNIDSTLIILRSKYKNKIEIKKEYGLIPDIDCNPGKLNQVFLNIIVNAIQAIEGEGIIKIRTYMDDSNKSVNIEISDTGTGMPEEKLSKIFEPFYTSKDPGEGTGLGLSISRSIIEQHNGNISVESKLGQGSKFIIQLPVENN